MFRRSGASGAPPEIQTPSPIPFPRPGPETRGPERSEMFATREATIVSTDPFSPTGSNDSRRRDNDGQLSVGPDIHLNGAISSCRTLIVDGRVEGEVDAGELVIGEPGAVSGTVRVGSADIEGSFGGELVVDGELTIRAKGRVDGVIRYGQIMIEAGGRITGDVRVNGAEDAAPAEPGDDDTSAEATGGTTATFAEDAEKRPAETLESDSQPA